MKILHILYQSAPNISGSSTRSQAILVNQRKHGLESFVISSPGQVAESKQNRVGSEIIDGIKFVRTNIFNGLTIGARSSVANKIKKIIAFPYFVYRLLILCREEKPEILHAHAMFYCGIAALMAGRICRIPVVYEIRSIWYDNSNAKQVKLVTHLARLLERFVIRRCNAVVAISSGIQEEYRELRDDIVVIRNGVNIETIIEPVYNESFLKFGYIGSLIELEGLYGVIKTFGELKREGYSYEFHVYGDGPICDDLKRFAEKHESPVIFWGKVTHADIGRCYANLDCIINFRNDEKVARLVTPLKPLEAIAFGKPLICTNVAGYREIVGDGQHVHYVTSGNVQELKQAVRFVAADKNRTVVHQMVSTAQKFIREERSWSSNVAEYRQVYERLVKLGRG